MSSSNTNSIIKSITSGFASDLTPLPEIVSSVSNAATPSLTNTDGSFFANITWQTWIIIILVLALLGINIFTYLARGTEGAVSIFDKIFAPILKLFGLVTLETTKQTIQNTQTGTNAAVNAVADTSVNAINAVANTSVNGLNAVANTSVNGLNSVEQRPANGSTIAASQPLGSLAKTSQGGAAVNYQTEAKIEKYKEDTLEKALSNASQSANEVQPSESSVSIGKAGWCYIGEDLGVRTCTNIGVNDVCMSGDIFPTQEVCINPNLRP